MKEWERKKMSFSILKRGTIHPPEKRKDSTISESEVLKKENS